MTESATSTVKSFCNALAIQRGIDAAGSAGSFETLALVETPLPWKRGLYDEAGALPQQALDLMQLWLKRYHEGLPYNQYLLLVAPDPQYSRPGFRRVMYFTHPSGQSVSYDKIEYLVPEAQVGELLWALFEAPDALAAYQPFREAVAESQRDLLVCMHGTVDAACSKFGYPLYKMLRTDYAAETLRVWRVSHFGGHLFAPTLMDMPSARYWAYVEAEQAEQIVRQSGSLEAMRTHYRGCAAFEHGLMQAAERDVWQREGWQWFSYPKSGQILTKDEENDEPQWALVRFDYTSPEGAAAYQARVEISSHIETEHSSGSPKTYAYPQYRVTSLEKTETASAKQQQAY